MKQLSRVVALCLGVSILGCGGGGGGGSSSGFYGGTWDINAVRVVNDCGLAIAPTFSNTLVVNQDGTRVVVDSGSRVLQGQTNDKDGFTVTDTLPPSNGCVSGAAYSFSDASDGEADVGVALVVRCGSRECVVAYGGKGVRRNGKAATKRFTPSTDESRIAQALEEKSLAGGGEEAKGTPEESVSELAELAAPAS